MLETIRRTFAINNNGKYTKNKATLVMTGINTSIDSNEETDSSLSDDFKSIQNSIVSINRPASIVLKSFAPTSSSLLSTPSLHDDGTPWLHENITREAVEQALLCRSIGSFLVRRPTSVTSANTYVLSVRIPRYMKRSSVVHYLIDHDVIGFRLRGTKKVFPTLKSFIVHHSIVAESLPVVLDLRPYRSLDTMDNDGCNDRITSNEYVI